jgi:hypothetical protein
MDQIWYIDGKSYLVKRVYMLWWISDHHGLSRKKLKKLITDCGIEIHGHPHAISEEDYLQLKKLI